MTVRAVLDITVTPGRADEFVTAWREVAAAVRTNPGNLRQSLVRDRDDPHRFLIMTDWADADAFRRFETSPEQDDLTAGLRELRQSARMTVYDLAHHVEGKEAT